MVFNADDYAKLIYHNRASTDFGIMINKPWKPVVPTSDGTNTHITGRNGDLSIDNQAYNNVVETFTATVIRDAQIYPTWFDWRDAISSWLQIGVSYSELEFDYYPDWDFVAQAQSYDLDVTSDYQATLTLTFNCQPLMVSQRGLTWKKFPLDGAIMNQTDFPVHPELHIVGTGDFQITVNDMIYFFDDVEDELYLTSEGNAYFYDKDGAITLANDQIRLVNNDSPVFLCGENKVSASGQPDQQGSITIYPEPPKVYYKAKWKKVIS